MKQKEEIGTETFTEGFLFTNAEMEQVTDRQPEVKRRGRRRSTVIEPRPSLPQEKMRELLEDIKEIETATGIRYINLHLTKKMIIGVRESSGKEFTINLDELYKAYQQCRRFTSPEVKRYIFMGHSPAAALLKLLKNKATVNE